jgi:hypothetical protein
MTGHAKDARRVFGAHDQDWQQALRIAELDDDRMGVREFPSQFANPFLPRRVSARGYGEQGNGIGFLLK